MRDKGLEAKRDNFVVAYYKYRRGVNSQLTKEDIVMELNSFYCFYSKSNLYRILQGH